MVNLCCRLMKIIYDFEASSSHHKAYKDAKKEKILENRKLSFIGQLSSMLICRSVSNWTNIPEFVVLL